MIGHENFQRGTERYADKAFSAEQWGGKAARAMVENEGREQAPKKGRLGRFFSMINRALRGFRRFG